MTKEKAEITIQGIIYTLATNKNESVASDRATKVVNEIFNDFKKASEYNNKVLLAQEREIATMRKQLLESRTCENCKHCDEQKKGEIIHCEYFEQFFPIEIGKCDKWETK